jgi:hypothetical protein
MKTLVLPLVTRPTCIVGEANAPSTMPACGGVLYPDDPTTAAALPPIWTLVTRFCVNGAENGRGPAG